MTGAKHEPTTPAADGAASPSGSGAAAQGEEPSPPAAAPSSSRATTAPSSTPAIANQTIINQAARPGADVAELRNAYLAWVSLSANQLPLFAETGGKQAQLAAVYTALLTRGFEAGASQQPESGDAALHRLDRDGGRQSALEALDAEGHLVLMGGPGSGKTTFLNYVALCMAGELLGLETANLERLRTPIPPDPAQDSGGDAPAPQRWSRPALLPVRVLLRDFAADLPPAGTELTAYALLASSPGSCQTCCSPSPSTSRPSCSVRVG